MVELRSSPCRPTAALSGWPTSSAVLAVKPEMPLLLLSSSSASGMALRCTAILWLRDPANNPGLPSLFLQSPQALAGGTLRRSARKQDLCSMQHSGRAGRCRELQQQKHAQLLAMPSSLALILSSLCGTGKKAVPPIPERILSEGSSRSQSSLYLACAANCCCFR